MRYFLEVSYFGYAYSGSQIQINGITVQEVIEKVLYTFLKQKIILTGASRTDAGVHAKQNFFHFDTDIPIQKKIIYNLNALLPLDIAIQNIIPVSTNANCRFDADKRYYEYIITQAKNPFLVNRSYYYPYTINKEALEQTACYILKQTRFDSFSKKHVQVKTFDCHIFNSVWEFCESEKQLVYKVSANRFLRGMVKALVSSQLEVARGNMMFADFEKLFIEPKIASAFFTAPSHGLYLVKTDYPQSIYSNDI